MHKQRRMQQDGKTCAELVLPRLQPAAWATVQQPATPVAAWAPLSTHLVLICTASFSTPLKAPQSSVLPAPAQLTVPPESAMVWPSRTKERRLVKAPAQGDGQGNRQGSVVWCRRLGRGTGGAAGLGAGQAGAPACAGVHGCVGMASVHPYPLQLPPFCVHTLCSFRLCACMHICSFHSGAAGTQVDAALPPTCNRGPPLGVRIVHGRDPPVEAGDAAGTVAAQQGVGRLCGGPGAEGKQLSWQGFAPRQGMGDRRRCTQKPGMKCTNNELRSVRPTSA